MMIIKDHYFNPRILRRAIVRFVIAWLFYAAGVFIPWKYPSQACKIIAFIFLALSLKAIIDWIPKTLKKQLSGTAIGKIAILFSKIGKQIVRAVTFFLPKQNMLTHGSDEKYSLFDELAEKRKLRKANRITNTIRYRDIEDNAEKIRFIYTKYLLAKMKKGLRIEKSDTPDEISDIIGEGDGSTGLFALYDGARYNANAEITDTDVDACLSLIEKRKTKKAP